MERVLVCPKCNNVFRYPYRSSGRKTCKKCESKLYISIYNGNYNVFIERRDYCG